MKARLTLVFILVAFIPFLVSVYIDYFSDSVNWERDREWMIGMVIKIGVTILVSTLAATLGAGWITKKLKALADVGRSVAGGDLTRDVTVRATDEVGVLADALREMVKNLRDVVQRVQGSTANMYEAIQNLTVSTGEVSGATAEIAHNIQNIARGAEFQAASVEKAVESTQRLSDSSDTIAQRSVECRTIADESMSRGEEGLGAAREATASMNNIRQHMEVVGTEVYTFRDLSSEISALVEGITTLSHQTHILALNATIEAARAGDAGRGFAVVAEEVRRLAESTRDLADQIARIAGDITQRSQDVVTRVTQTNEATAAGETRVTSLSAILDGIADAATRTRDAVGTIVEESDSQAKASTQLRQSMNDIQGIATDNAAGTQQASASTEETTASMEEIDQQVKALLEESNNLRGLVERFRL